MKSVPSLHRSLTHALFVVAAITLAGSATAKNDSSRPAPAAHDDDARLAKADKKAKGDKGKGKGDKAKDEGEKAEEKAPEGEAPAGEAPPADAAGGEMKDHAAKAEAWKAKRIAAENEKHMMRLAKIGRIEAIATEKSDAELTATATKLKESEVKRHEAALVRIDEIAKKRSEAKAEDAKAEEKAEKDDAKPQKGGKGKGGKPTKKGAR